MRKSDASLMAIACFCCFTACIGEKSSTNKPQSLSDEVKFCNSASDEETLRTIQFGIDSQYITAGVVASCSELLAPIEQQELQNRIQNLVDYICRIHPYNAGAFVKTQFVGIFGSFEQPYRSDLEDGFVSLNAMLCNERLTFLRGANNYTTVDAPARDTVSSPTPEQ